MSRHGSIPSGWPKKLTGPLAWNGKDLETSLDSYTYKFTPQDIAHIEAATANFQKLGIARGLASPSTFPLPECLSQQLKAVADAVYEGCGFMLLRGLEPSKYTEEEVVVLYVGLTGHVANQRARNIDHIRDRTQDNPKRDSLRPLELPVAMGFHTDVDSGDMVAMFTLTTPEKGGNQYLASMASVYNVLQAKSPEVIRQLSENWYWERVVRTAPGEEKIEQYDRPLIGYENERLQVNFAATFVGGNPEYPLSKSAPRLSQVKKRALEALQRAASETQISISPQPGDLLFVNNYALMHARDSWTDLDSDLHKQRYVMRLWLHDDEKGWQSAVSLKRRNNNFDLPPEKQALMTFTEWQALPRAHRVKENGVSARDCHD